MALDFLEHAVRVVIDAPDRDVETRVVLALPGERQQLEAEGERVGR